MFKPMLICNEQPDFNTIKYPCLVSTKLDGCRCIFINGKMLSRSLKEIPNKQLQEKFQPLKDFSLKHNIILDGEIYSHEMNFQEIISYVMTEDFNDKKNIKKFGEIKSIPYHLKFWCFDCIIEENYNKPFEQRYLDILRIFNNQFENLVVSIDQHIVSNFDVLKKRFELVLEKGFEGLVVKSHTGKYKCGRSTLKEEIAYKYKPFETFDAKIIDIIQGTEVNPNAEKSITELGYSKTSRKKDDRILIEKASAFLVNYNEFQLKVSIALTDEEKEEIWKNKNVYIGKWIEYKGMLIGSKDVPRHPIFLRFRNDKD